MLRLCLTHPSCYQNDRQEGVSLSPYSIPITIFFWQGSPDGPVNISEIRGDPHLF